MSEQFFKKFLMNRYPNMHKRLSLLKRRYLLRTQRPNWNEILAKDKAKWKNAITSAKNGPKILIGTTIGAHLPGTSFDSLLSCALILRGADVHVLLCDSFLPACLEGIIEHYPNLEQFIRYGHTKDRCKDCFSTAYKMFNSLGIRVYRYSEFVTPEEISLAKRIATTVPVNAIGGYKLDGLVVGEHALAGALRFYGRGTIDRVPYNEAVLRRYFNAALLTTYATSRLLKKVSFESVVTHHGIYVPHGLIGEVARCQNVRVVTWISSYRKRTFIFSHKDTYHQTLMYESVDKWENVKWTPQIEAQLMDYLKSRWYGTHDWIFFPEKPEMDLATIIDEIHVDFSKPLIGLLTNVFWDAQLHYRTNAFPNMLEWVLKTIEYFSNRPELQLLIRVHPAEIRGTRPSLQPIIDEIKKVFPVLPQNIFIIPPESRTSTYAAMEQCNAVIIYGTKTGVELTSIGIPVIVAGEAWIRNKGVTMDASTVKDYFKLLDQLPLKQRMDKLKVLRARKYAYHFFFRRMILLKFMEPDSPPMLYRFRFNGLDDLLPGRHVGLDVICKGILDGADFIYPAEQCTQDHK